MTDAEIINRLESAERELREAVDYFDVDSAQLGFSIATDLARIREEIARR